MGSNNILLLDKFDNFFKLLNFKYKQIKWDKYYINKLKWQDFVKSDVKIESHWADIYYTKLQFKIVCLIG